VSKHQMKRELKSDFFGLAILALSLISLAGLVITEISGQHFSSQAIGAVGRFLVRTLAGLFGQGKYLFPIGMGYLGIKIFQDYPRRKFKRLFIGIIIIYSVILAILHLQLMQNGQEFLNILRVGYEGKGGGVIGALIAFVLSISFGPVGSYIVLITLVLISMVLITNISVKEGLQKIKNSLTSFFNTVKEELYNFLFYEIEVAEEIEDDVDKDISKSDFPVIIDHTQNEGEHYIKANRTEEKKRDPTEDGRNADEAEKSLLENQEKSSHLFHGYNLPPIDILKKPIKLKKSRIDKDLTDKVRLLEQTLASFGVQVKVTQVSCGPVVTRYELQPAKGVKVSKIVSLSDDIALSLAASDVRIEAPIPGKAAIGIEVPNREVSVVYFREVLESKEFTTAKSPLIVALGKDISGNPVVANLKDMPHLLIAGATGSGKSVCMNTLIASLLFKNKPDSLKLMIIDPKRVELTYYNGIPHLLCPVVTEPKKAATALRWMVKEMENRYEKFAVSGVRDIDRYNEFASKNEELERLPYVIVLIDELADLMMVAPTDVEDCICRLAQMARAAGIHLVVATQRPSVDVITGLIKANIPSRIAFAVSSQTDSRTILDLGGAEKLLGRGDMLFYPVGAVKPVRVQGAYISDQEVETIVRFLKNQGAPDYEDELIDYQRMPPEEAEEAEDNELLAKALQFCIEHGQASISLLQRRLHIGYTRAARLIDIMEKKGYVGPYEGSKPRTVLISWEQFQKIFQNENSK